MSAYSPHLSKVYWKSLGIIAFIKVFIHLFANVITEFGLHRDEYLYISESDHLAWGYMEVPPVISILGWISRGLFGDTLLAVKIFPVLVGVATIFLLGVFIRDLGGGKWAQIIGATGFLLSPAYLGSNGLFQPVSFNQFFWFLSVVVLLKILNYRQIHKKESIQLWLIFGGIAGLAFLTKYSIVFFFIGIISALLLTPFRKVFLSKYPYLAILLYVIIISPNLWWQISHDFPIAKHMTDLKATQLVNVSWQDYFSSQFVFHFLSSIIWIGGLIFGIRSQSDSKYRLFTIVFLVVIFLIFGLSGKAYYTLGAFTMMFGLGGVAFEKWFGSKAWRILPLIALGNLFALPIALPILPVEQMKSYSEFLQNDLNLTGPFKWEDGVVRSLKQDYADMLGYEELPEKVAMIYHSLSDEEKANCLIWGGHYGQAGVLNLYRKKYDLPSCYSFNASFVAWVPQDFDIKAQIQVEDQLQDPSPYFEQTILMDSIEHPLARDPGYIYLKIGPKMDLRPIWKEIVREERVAAGYSPE